MALRQKTGKKKWFSSSIREKKQSILHCSMFAAPQRLIDLDEWRQTLVENEIRKIHETERKIVENYGTMETYLSTT